MVFLVHDRVLEVNFYIKYITVEPNVCFECNYLSNALIKSICTYRY